MINDLFMPIRRVSAHVRGLMWIAAACGLAYYLSVLQQSMPLPVLYRGCMVELAERVILPANLMLFCMGCARFGAFERVRRDPRDEFRLNAAWLALVALSIAVSAWVLFVVANMLKGSLCESGQWSLCVVMLLQLFMMNMSVALLVWLLMNLGIPWGQILPPAIWLNTFYFWYPIGDSWATVFVRQVLPFIGYCMLMAMMNMAAFHRADRLRLR